MEKDRSALMETPSVKHSGFMALRFFEGGERPVVGRYVAGRFTDHVSFGWLLNLVIHSRCHSYDFQRGVAVSARALSATAELTV
jgi:hypothetical protein